MLMIAIISDNNEKRIWWMGKISLNNNWITAIMISSDEKMQKCVYIPIKPNLNLFSSLSFSFSLSLLSSLSF